MRVLHAVGWYFPDTTGGTEVYVQGLSRHLRQRGHEVIVVAPRAASTSMDEYQHDGLPVLRYPIPAEPSRDEAQGATRARGAEAFAAILDRVRPDVFHVHSLVTGLGIFEIEAASDRDVPIIYTNHLPSMGFACPRGTLLRWGTTACTGQQSVRTCAACALDHRDTPPWLSQLLAAIPARIGGAASMRKGRWATGVAMTALVAQSRERQRRLNTLVDRIVVLNDAAREIFLAHGAAPERVVVNRLGVSGDRIHRKPGPDRQPTTLPVRVGFVARFDVAKGIRELAQAIQQLSPALPLRFDFRGPADDDRARGLREEMEQLLGSDRRVSFSPAETPDEIRRVLAATDVLVCPSIAFENGPTVALEAAAVGTPVIASSLGAPREFIRDGVNGRLIAPGDVAALVAALESIALDPQGTLDHWRRHLPSARGMTDVADDYQQLYRDLQSARAAAPLVQEPV